MIFEAEKACCEIFLQENGGKGINYLALSVFVSVKHFYKAY